MIVLFMILVAIFAAYPYAEVHPADRLQGSSDRYLLGTDYIGRDFLSRLIHGARISLLVGLAATTLNVFVAVLIGGISGFIGGKVDLVAQRFVDAMRDLLDPRLRGGQGSYGAMGKRNRGLLGRLINPFKG